MIKLAAILLLLLFTGKTFCQIDTASHTSIKTDYLKKSKTQKTIAWVLLAAGTTLIVVGGSVGTHAVDDISLNEAATGGSLIIAGAVMDLASIPLFIAGAKNKRRAMSVTINNDFIPKLKQGIVARIPMPTIGLKLRL